MNPLYVDGAYPRRADPAPHGPGPRPNGASSERARELAALFTAQVQRSMLDSLMGLAAADPEAASGDEGAGELGGFDELDASLGTGGLGGTELASAGAGIEAMLAQQLLGALGPAGATGASAPKDARANAKVVAGVAREQGVDPVTAVAVMLVESGGDAGAVGDGGTSFGLFQLHEGGMLTSAGLTPAQAYDPRTNATVSLRALAHEWRKGPNRSPGKIAAASQRPADPAGYARKVDAAMDRARALLS